MPISQTSSPRPGASTDAPAGRLERLLGQFDQALARLDGAPTFAKVNHQGPIYDLAVRLVKLSGGAGALAERAPAFEGTGMFHGSDWANPATLVPELVSGSLRGPALSVAVELLSELRLLAVAEGRMAHPEVDAEAARTYLEQALALNLDLLHPAPAEADRAQAPALREGIRSVLQLISERIGSAGILERLVDEAERVLDERPIHPDRVQALIESCARALDQGGADPQANARAWRLVLAERGPTALCRQWPQLDDYQLALADKDDDILRAEAAELAASMHATGLVARQHPRVLSEALRRGGALEIIAAGLGLDAVGLASLDAYSGLVQRVIEVAIVDETRPAVQGLAHLLNRGVLFFPPAAPGLWRLAGLSILPEVGTALQQAARADLAPGAVLLAGAVAVLGMPLGIGQGDNPTCQSARAISLWAQCDPGFLMELISAAARDGSLEMHFEGRSIQSHALEADPARPLDPQLDPVSLVLVPHLDRIYAEMSRHVAGRGDDGHRWINPEFHGFWVYRGFACAVEVASGTVPDITGFLRNFYASYHPYHNGGRALIYPQPAGVAATDSSGRFVGWHAVSIQRVMLDPRGVMRVYFYNPNDSGRQNWGQDIETQTSGFGERPGESSLPFEQFAARVYAFHYSTREHGDPDQAPGEEIAQVAELARNSWGANFPWTVA